LSPRAFDPDEVADFDANFRCIARIEFEIGLLLMAHEPRRQAGSGHGVPLISQSTGVQHQTAMTVGRCGRRMIRSRDEISPTILCRKYPVAKESCIAAIDGALPHGPLNRNVTIVGGVAYVRQFANIENAATIILETGKRRMFAKNIGRLAVRKRVFPA